MALYWKSSAVSFGKPFSIVDADSTLAQKFTVCLAQQSNEMEIFIRQYRAAHKAVFPARLPFHIQDSRLLIFYSYNCHLIVVLRHDLIGERFHSESKNSGARRLAAEMNLMGLHFPIAAEGNLLALQLPLLVQYEQPRTFPGISRRANSHLRFHKRIFEDFPRDRHAHDFRIARNIGRTDADRVDWQIAGTKLHRGRGQICRMVVRTVRNQDDAGDGHRCQFPGDLLQSSFQIRAVATARRVQEPRNPFRRPGEAEEADFELLR